MGYTGMTVKSPIFKGSLTPAHFHSHLVYNRRSSQNELFIQTCHIVGTAQNTIGTSDK